ncbi:hypothetical protein [Fluviispira sanaruensis]|uniref:Lipoprotein n=1 Tax=Fluviispira sanaruensis TaxID=2493639 RepID=A0A4P2VKV9_FLUSA|nr:hypothetical protein [Fluviispira sanaruensis]BBH53268.1 hypothetical protein JCM31447_17110 [Fluviispira sanaruensis]
MKRIFSLFILLIFFISCKKPDSTYYTINQVRVVAALFQTSALVTGTTINGTSTQQFPMRPNETCTGAPEFNIVVISPTSEIPTLTINSLKVAGIGYYYLAKGGGGRGLPNGTKGTSLPLTTFFSSATPATTTIMTSPFRLTVFTFTAACVNFNNANLTTNLETVNDIPAFMINYSVTSGVSTDQGFYTFYYLPLKTDSWWSSAAVTSSVSSKISSITSGLAVTNSPSQFGTLSPIASSTINANSGNAISAPVTIPNVPTGRDANSSLFQASTRIQWYVTSGSLDLDTAAITTWNPETTAGTSVGGLVVVRDLLGGVDFKIFGPFTTQ